MTVYFFILNLVLPQAQMMFIRFRFHQGIKPRQRNAPAECVLLLTVISDRLWSLFPYLVFTLQVKRLNLAYYQAYAL